VLSDREFAAGVITDVCSEPEGLLPHPATPAVTTKVHKIEINFFIATSPLIYTCEVIIITEPLMNLEYNRLWIVFLRIEKAVSTVLETVMYL
jgi:hypothetical protein